MTVEVAVINRQAVALAADSAVTLQGGSGQKIYNTVNKIFALSKSHPVGLMAYSSADVMGVPIETVVKVFRKRHLNSKPSDHLDGYRERFQRFLESDAELFPGNSRIEQCLRVASLHLEELRQKISYGVIAEYPGLCGPSKMQLRRFATQAVDRHCEKFRSSPELPGVTPRLYRLVRSLMKQIVEYWQSLLCDELNLTKQDSKQLLDLCVNLILKEESSGSETGIVIAGFGDRDYFPQIRSFEFESSFENVHKVRSGDSVSLPNDPACVKPFAQTDIIDAIYKGRDPNFDKAMNTWLETEWEHMRVNQTSGSLSPEAVEQINRSIDMLSKQFTDHLKEYLDKTTKSYTEPLEQTVAVMPKEELAMMAEALVNITSMHRKMSPGSETVGGPTDVAVISKGDGFVWIKRKHYFDPKFNPTFVNNYLRT